MSNEYIDEDRDSIRIEGLAAHGDTYVTICALNGAVRSARISNADVPTVAAELLKAAGYDYLAGYIEGDIDHRERLAEKAEAKAAEKKLQERRDAVLAALLPEAAAANNLPEPHELSTLCDRAIDRIIELEDGASRD